MADEDITTTRLRTRRLELRKRAVHTLLEHVYEQFSEQSAASPGPLTISEEAWRGLIDFIEGRAFLRQPTLRAVVVPNLENLYYYPRPPILNRLRRTNLRERAIAAASRIFELSSRVDPAFQTTAQTAREVARRCELELLEKEPDLVNVPCSGYDEWFPQGPAN